MLVAATLLLGFVLVALVSGNNLSVCFGGAIASRILGKKTGMALAIMGYVLGLLLQGNMLHATAATLFASGNEAVIDAVLAVAIAIFALSQAKRIPQSLSIMLTTSLWGVGIASGTMNWLFATYTIAYWLIAPLLSLVLAILFMRLFRAVPARRRIWSYTRAMRLALVIASFFMALTLGSNTIGLVEGLMPDSAYLRPSLIVAIVLGSVLFSSGPLRKVGNEIMDMRYTNAAIPQLTSAIFVELATLLRIPLSNTQAFVSSIYGAGLSYRVRMMLKKPLLEMADAWVLTGLISLSAGFVLATLIH